MVASLDELKRRERLETLTYLRGQEANAREQAKLGDVSALGRYVFGFPAAEFHDEIADELNGGEDIILTLPARTGKALSVDSLIATPYGWRLNGDMVVGDTVLYPSGGKSIVTGVFPQGKTALYRVEFSDGAVACCTHDHLWSVETTHQRCSVRKLARARKGISRWGYPTKSFARRRRALPLSQLEQNLKAGEHHWRWYIPMVSQLDFRNIRLPIHPYVLGALLGDGSFGERCIWFTSTDEEIVRRLNAYLTGEAVLRQSKKRPIEYFLASHVKWAANSVLTALRKFGLAKCTSDRKFIPAIYKTASHDARVALLQGLMDTDGYADGHEAGITTVSQRLAGDVKEIAQSLGCNVSMRTKQPKYRYRDVLRDGKLAYCLYIAPPPYLCLFQLTRKVERFRPRTKFLPHRSIVSVDRIDDGDSQCISVSAPDGLYVTNESVVTHNTQSLMHWFLTLISKDADERIIYCTGNDLTATLVSNTVRNVIETSDAYHEICPGVTPDRAKGWNDNEWFIRRPTPLKDPTFTALGKGGAILTRGASRIVADDLILQPDEVATAYQREKLLHWFKTVLLSRCEPNTQVVIVMARWHRFDIAGALLDEMARGGRRFRLVRFPAANEDGSYLWEAQRPKEYWEKLRVSVGPKTWATSYQQEPSADETGEFKESWFKFYNVSEMPKFVRVEQSYDTALKTKEVAKPDPDYSVGLCAGLTERDDVYLLDMIRGQWNFPDLTAHMRAFYERWKPNAVRIEDKASGTSAIQELQTKSKLPIVAVQVDADKVTRARGITGWCEAGKVYLPADAEWVATWLSEVCAFPFGAKDDIVDTFSQLLRGLIGDFGRVEYVNLMPREELKAESTHGELLEVPRRKRVREMSDEEVKEELARRLSGRTQYPSLRNEKAAWKVGEM